MSKRALGRGSGKYFSFPKSIIAIIIISCFVVLQLSYRRGNKNFAGLLVGISSVSTLSTENKQRWRWQQPPCPVKIFVYDMGFSNIIATEVGFNATTERRQNYTYISMNNHFQHQWFIIQKFLLYSRCSVKDPLEADFFLLPSTDRNANKLDELVSDIENNYNKTFHQRGQRDHIIADLHNTKKGYELMRSMSNRSIEFVRPMVKLLVEMFGYWYFFQARSTYNETSSCFMDYETLMTVASELFFPFLY